jgi:hypothetical protein
VFVNRVLRRIFGPKRDKVTGGWRKLHNEELRDLYSSPSIMRMIKLRRKKWAGYVARMGEKRNAYKLLVGKLEGKDQDVGRWRMDLVEVGWGDVDWIGVAQDRDKCRALVKEVMRLFNWWPLCSAPDTTLYICRPLLWSSGQSSWLQI